MNDKILVEIFFPALVKSFDVYIPDNISFYRIIKMLQTVSDQVSDGLYVPSGDSVLCDGESGAILDVNQTARELCLHNGSKLIFI